MISKVEYLALSPWQRELIDRLKEIERKIDKMRYSKLNSQEVKK